MKSISIIGAGNVAWHLAPALDNTDFSVREVYSRKEAHAAELVSRLYNAEAKSSTDFSESRSDIFILTVTDDALEEVAGSLILPPHALLVHTSGSQPLEILETADTPRIGVFYPLQTFSKGKKVDFKETPIFVEGREKRIETELLSMAKAISAHAYKISSEKRKALHMAAAFACNFTNYMLLLAQEIMKRNKLDYAWLKPLIAETINKSMDIGPEKAQTGPARRGDVETLDKHMELLEYDEDLAEIYRLISQHILNRYES